VQQAEQSLGIIGAEEVSGIVIEGGGMLSVFQFINGKEEGVPTLGDGDHAAGGGKGGEAIQGVVGLMEFVEFDEAGFKSSEGFASEVDGSVLKGEDECREQHSEGEGQYDVEDVWGLVNTQLVESKKGGEGEG